MPPRDITGPKRKVVRRKAQPAGPAGAVGQAGPVAPKRVVRRAPGPPTGLSEQDRQKVRVYHRQVTQATQQAKHGQPFNAEHLRDAIASGVAKGVSEGPGNVFLVKHRRKFLPDDATPVTPEHGYSAKNYNDPKTFRRVQKAVDTQVMGDAIHAPALKVLEATAVPSHATAGVASGHTPGYGIHHKTTFGPLLRGLGVPKGLASAGGFALDVGTDPTTYATFGAGSVAEKAALKAARDAEQQAARQAAEAAAKETARGGSEASAQRASDAIIREGQNRAKNAAQRTAAAHSTGKGVTVKFAGREVPGVRSATAQAGRGVKRVVARAPQRVKNAGAGARALAGEFRPTLTPSGADPAAHVAARQAARSTRAFTHGHIAKADAQARGLQAAIPGEHMPAVLHAIETNKVRSLPDELAGTAHRLRSAYKGAKRLRQRAGIAEGTVGPGRKIQVPTVTVDVQASRAKLDAARRDLAAQTRLHQDSLTGFGVARGRAQILSRNVAGSVGEKRAQALTVPDTVNQFAGGGHGVRQAAQALQAGGRNLAKARDRVRQLEENHATVVETARQQRVSRGRALKAQERAKGAAQGYVPHAQHGPLYEGLGIVEPTVEKPKPSGTMRNPGSAKKRQDLRPIAAQNPERVAEGKDPFATDIPLLHVNYGRQTARAVGAGRLEQQLGELGRVVKPKIVKVTGRGGKVSYRRDYTHAAEPKPSEAVYHVGYTGKGSNYSLRDITDEWKRGEIPPTGKVVIADRKAVEAARVYAKPTQASSTVGRLVDRTTRGFKTVATFTPGFHARNAVGDTQMGYLVQPGHRVPANMIAASKAVKGLAAQRRAVEKLSVDATDHGTIKVAGRDMPIREFIARADRAGILQTGPLTGELRDLGGEAVRGLGRSQPKTVVGRTAQKMAAAGRKGGRVVGQNRVVKALTQDRENVVRMATFKHGLDIGLSDPLAADLSMGAHIDYADLTEVERKYARRLMPFYTFSARALPLHVKTLVTRPGKFANIEKAREEIGGTDASGYTPWQQRQYPVNVGKVGVTDSLPLTLLNEVPVSTKPGEYGSELGQFAANLVNPIFKDPVEYYANRSLAFRDNIQDPKHPLVSAPDWVGNLSAPVRKELGAVQGPDKRTGKTVWLWPGKHDYVMRAVALGPFNIANQLATTGTNRIGQGKVAKAVAGVTGVRIQPQDKVSAAINERYDKLNKLTEKQAALGQQINPKNGLKISAKNPTPEYLRNATTLKQLDREIYALSKKRGDKVLPRAGAPPKGRGGGSVGGGFGGGFGGFGGAGFK